MHQQLRKYPRQVRPCNRTSYPTLERAREVIYLMTNRGVNTSRLRVVPCLDCHKFHLKYTK
jgi:hypothetical protein